MFLLKPQRVDFAIFLKIALPLILTGLIESSINFFSTFFLAHLGEQALAAGALAAWLFSTMMVIFWGTFSSTSMLIARKFGEKDHHAISQILRDSMILAILLTVPSFIALRYLPSLFALFKQPVSLVNLAYSYVDAMSWCILPDFIGLVLIQFLTGLGHTRITLFFSLIWVPVNIISNAVLVFGKWGFPAFGIAGIGWGTTFSFWLYTITLFLYLMLHKNYRIYLEGIFEKSPIIYLKELIAIGLPAGGMLCIELGFFFVLTLIMGQFGTLFIAANQLTMQFLGFLTSISFATAGAITVRMGHMLGEKNLPAAKRALSAGILFNTSLMGLLALVYWFFPNLFLGIDLNLTDPKNKEIITIVKGFFIFTAVFQLIESVRIAFYGGLRAFKDTHYSFITSIISFWCIPLPLGWFLVTFLHWQPHAYWFAMTIGTACGVWLLRRRLTQKMAI